MYWRLHPRIVSPTWDCIWQIWFTLTWHIRIQEDWSQIKDESKWITYSEFFQKCNNQHTPIFQGKAKKYQEKSAKTKWIYFLFHWQVYFTSFWPSPWIHWKHTWNTWKAKFKGQRSRLNNKNEGWAFKATWIKKPKTNTLKNRYVHRKGRIFSRSHKDSFLIILWFPMHVLDILFYHIVPNLFFVQKSIWFFYIFFKHDPSRFYRFVFSFLFAVILGSLKKK